MITACLSFREETVRYQKINAYVVKHKLNASRLVKILRYNVDNVAKFSINERSDVENNTTETNKADSTPIVANMLS